jgi:hypothetical protein
VSYGPAPYPPFLPTGPELPPPDDGRRARKRWYGWQILIPTLASDTIGIVGVFTSNGYPTGLGVAIAGLVGHGISGPIVHLAHGHPLTALASLGLEGALPGAVLGLGLGSCTSQTDGCLGGLLFTLFVGLPIALTAGTSIDSAALAWEDRPRNDALTPTVRVAPLVLPPLRMGTVHLPPPAGAALVGTF